MRNFEGYYSLSFTRIEGADSARVRGEIELRSTTDSTFQGRFSFHLAPEQRVRGSVVDGVLDGGVLRMTLGSPVLTAEFAMDPGGDGLLRGQLVSQEYGSEAVWPATAAFRRGFVAGVHLFELSYEMLDGEFWGIYLGRLEFSDQAIDSVRVTGSISEFIRDSIPWNPYIRVGEVEDVNTFLSVSSEDDFRVELPLSGRLQECRGSGFHSERASLLGTCALGPLSTNEIPFFFWSIPEGVEAQAVFERLDTLPLLGRSTPGDRFSRMRFPVQATDEPITAPSDIPVVQPAGLVASWNWLSSTPDLEVVDGLPDILQIAGHRDGFDVAVSIDRLFLGEFGERPGRVVKEFYRSSRRVGAKPSLHVAADRSILTSYADTLWIVGAAGLELVDPGIPLHGRERVRILLAGSVEGDPWVVSQGTVPEGVLSSRTYLERRTSSDSWTSVPLTLVGEEERDLWWGITTAQDTVYVDEEICLDPGRSIYGTPEDRCAPDRRRTRLLRWTLEGTVLADTLSVRNVQVQPGPGPSLYGRSDLGGVDTFLRFRDDLQRPDTLLVLERPARFSSMLNVQDWRPGPGGRVVVALRGGVILLGPNR